ncbi:MAG TPA: hypothetical protein VFN02_00165 [Ktedonobacteraceae bacterium]|nr:hypothetical protein [Ktedonobacteraceae bacterium]
MKTQSTDTHPDVERVLIALLRQASSQKRFQSVQAVTRSGIWASVHSWLHHHPEACEREAAVHYVASAYGEHLAQVIQKRLLGQEHWQVQPVDLLAILAPVFGALASVGIRSYIGGSLASSLHGMQQLAQDIDLVVHPECLGLAGNTLWRTIHTPALKEHYIIDEEAVQQGKSVSLLHLDTLMKVDVIVPQHQTFDFAMAQSIEMLRLDERYAAFPVASAVEMVLWKMIRYHVDTLARHDGMEDDAGWNDILGMLKVQGTDLDRLVLEEWAKQFAIEGVLEQALSDAGVSDVPRAP